MHRTSQLQSRPLGQRLASLARTVPAVLALAALAVPVQVFAQSPVSNVSLGDIVGGGNGSGTGTYNTGIAARDGVSVGTAWSGYADDGLTPFNTPVTPNSRINGVFIPKGTTQIATTGLSYAFPSTSGKSWDAIRNGVSTMETNGDVNPIYDTTGAITTMGVGMHANSGITFDLLQIGAAYPGKQATSFSGNVGGKPNPIRCGTGDAVAHVLIDGVLVYSKQVGLAPDASKFFDIPIPSGARFLTLAVTDGGNGDGCDKAYFANALVEYVPTVYASGISPVKAWDPIFLDGPVPDYAESRPAPTVGYNDPRWANGHNAIVFPFNTHPWERESWVQSAFKFSANWINAWAGYGQLNQDPGLHSDLHGKTSASPGWAANGGVPYQSYTKYSTTVYGEGDFVLQFLADNVSWIYVDGALVGYQDFWWNTSGTGRYLITLSGAGPHDLGFVIWDGGGLAGGKFRLETGPVSKRTTRASRCPRALPPSRSPTLPTPTTVRRRPPPSLPRPRASLPRSPTTAQPLRPPTWVPTASSPP